jgi:hypothetical protein
MIHRGFWLTAGAVTGIYGYRRVSAIGRRLSGTLNLSEPAPRRARRGAVALSIQTYRFTRDVREGMELYLARHSVPAGSTLSTGRALSADRSLSTDHDAQPEDGH